MGDSIQGESKVEKVSQYFEDNQYFFGAYILIVHPKFKKERNSQSSYGFN